VGYSPRSRCADFGVHDGNTSVHVPDLGVHDAPISVFTMARFGRSRWPDFRTNCSALPASAGTVPVFCCY
jgi:hypothetical protein